MKQLWAVVLAAGEGKRMHSRLPKVLHPLCGRPMLGYILESASELTEKVVIVVGYGAASVQAAMGDQWRYALQRQQLGTGHAVVQALRKLPPEGTLLLLCGDTPLLKKSHLNELLNCYKDKTAVVTTTTMDDPSGYGRIVLDRNGLVERIVEEADATAKEKRICEVNTGTYCFDLAQLRHYLPRITADNTQKEYYITDVIALMRNDGHPIGICRLEDSRVGLGINNRAQMAEAAAILRKQINSKLMLEGITIEDPNTVYIDFNVQIGPDTSIRPNSLIEGVTVIGSECLIGPNVHLCNALIEDGVVVENSVVRDSTIVKGSKVGPYCRVISTTKSPGN